MPDRSGSSLPWKGADDVRSASGQEGWWSSGLREQEEAYDARAAAITARALSSAAGILSGDFPPA